MDRENRRSFIILVSTSLAFIGGWLAIQWKDPWLASALGNQSSPPTQSIASDPSSSEFSLQPSRLADAHTESLTNQSYTVDSSLLVTPENSNQLGERIATLNVNNSHTNLLYHQEARGHFPRGMGSQPVVDVWVTSERTRLRVHDGTSARFYRYSSDIGRELSMITGESAIQTYLAPTGGITVSEIEYDGWIAYSIDVNREIAQPDTEQYHVSAIIDSFGLLREFQITVPATFFFSRHPPLFDWWPLPFRRSGVEFSISSLPHDLEVRYALKYTNVGDTTVQTPEWVDESIDPAVPIPNK